MPTNNFKLFDEKKANMMTDEEYAINQQRLNGVQSGVASSQLQNKTLYQTALMCYALAQLMAANGYDANDADAVSTFVNNLSLSMVQKVVDKASAADVANQVAGKWVDAKQLGELKTDVADNYLPLLGGTMLGDLILHSDPISSLQAATKQYVDKKSGFDVKEFSFSFTASNKSLTVNLTEDEINKCSFMLLDLDFSYYASSTSRSIALSFNDNPYAFMYSQFSDASPEINPAMSILLIKSLNISYFDWSYYESGFGALNVEKSNFVNLIDVRKITLYATLYGSEWVKGKFRITLFK